MIRLNIEASTAQELLHDLGCLATLMQAPGVYATVSTVEVKPGDHVYAPYPERRNPDPPVQEDPYGNPPAAQPVAESAPQPVAAAPQTPQNAPQPSPQVDTPPAPQAAPAATQPQQPAVPSKDQVKKVAAAWMSADSDTRMPQLQSIMAKNGTSSLAAINDEQLPGLVADMRALGVPI